MEGSSDRDILSSIDLMQEQINEVLQREKTPTPQKSSSSSKQSSNSPKLMLSLFQLFSGILFLVVSLMAVQATDVVYRLIAALFFLLSLISLLPILGDVFSRKYKQDGIMVLGFGLVLLLGISYYLLWKHVLMGFYTYFVIVLAVITLFGAFFFLVHAYIAYLKRIAQREVRSTFMLMLVSLVLLLASVLYQHFLLITIFFIVVLIFGKATVDITKRFMK